VRVLGLHAVEGPAPPYDALAEARRVPGVNGRLDVPAVLRGRNEIITDFDDATPFGFLQDRGVALFRGRGRGGALRRPPIEALDTIEGAWTNPEATTATTIPERLLVIGGGPVGVELAHAFQTLGSRVTLIEGERRLLPREEEYACAQLEATLMRHGVDVRTGQAAASFTQDGGVVTVTTTDGGTARGDVVLVALGRRAGTGDLGVEHVGLTPGETVDVDAQMRVSGVSWLYAVGDINGRTQHTHMGKYQARIAADHILGRDDSMSHGVDVAVSPRVIFTDPQIAAVGHTTETATRAGLEFDSYDTAPSGNLGGAVYDRGAPGTTRFSSIGDGGRSSAARSPAPTSPSSSTRRPSRSSARYRSIACATPFRRSPPAASSGWRSSSRPEYERASL
jgi:hypothetical protein